MYNLVSKNAGSRTWILVHSQMCRLQVIEMRPHASREARWTFYSLLFRLQYCSAPPSPHPTNIRRQRYFLGCHFMHQHIMKLLPVNLSNFWDVPSGVFHQDFTRLTVIYCPTLTKWPHFLKVLLSSNSKWEVWYKIQWWNNTCNITFCFYLHASIDCSEYFGRGVAVHTERLQMFCICES